MRFFHISDLHIGKQLYHYNMLAEQRDILEQIVVLTKKELPDAVVVAGDIYDVPVPSAEAVSVFDAFLSAINEIEPRIPVFVIAGNHDSAKRIDFASSILQKHGIYIAGLPPMQKEEYLKRVTMWDAYGEVNFYLLPYVKPSYVRNLCEQEINGYDMAVKMVLGREEIDTSKRNVLISHQFYTAAGTEPKTADSEVHLVGGIENVDVEALKPFDYAALGHIHRSQKIGQESYRYSGTPLQYSVSEAGNEKYITVVELREKGEKPLITELPLVPLRSVKRLTGTLKEVLAAAENDMQLRQDFVSVTLTDEIEVYQPLEQLREQFSHILEVRVDNARTQRLLEFREEEIDTLNPYDTFSIFFEEMNGRDLTPEEERMIKDIINQEMEEMGV